MNLHRIETPTQWESIKESDRNQWQRIAAASNSVLTLGNVFTVLGLGLVFYGLWSTVSGDLWTGISCVVAGRLCDLLDGWVAEATGTKSFLGEVLDAAADKIATISTLAVFGSMGIIPWLILGGLVLPHLLIPLIVYWRRRHGLTTHSSRIGKLSMASLWVSVIGYFLIYLQPGVMPMYGQVAVSLTTTFAIVSGLHATVNYLREPAK